MISNQTQKSIGYKQGSFPCATKARGTAFLFFYLFLILNSTFFILPQITEASLTDGLVGHWTFDGKDTIWTSATAGTALDRSGNGNTGTLTSMNRATSTISGRIGQALKFNGPSSKVVLTDIDALDSLGATTYCVWVYPTSLAVDQTFIGKYHGGTGTGVLFQTGGTVASRIMFGFNGSSLVTTSSSYLANNRWTHVCGSFDNNLGTGKHKIYVDGTSVAVTNTGTPDSITSTGASASVLNIGDNTQLSRFFVGKLDDAHIYNRALSATEISQLYKQGGTKNAVTPVRTASSTGLSSGLLGHWTFDGKDTLWTSSTTGTTLDKSGNGNTGTLTAMNRSTSTVAGKLGQAFKFNGGGAQRVDLASPTILDDIENQGGGGMTISAWIYPRGLGETNEGTIMNKSNVATVGNGAWTFQLSNSNNFRFNKSYTVTTLLRASANNTISLNKWQHVVMTWDGSATATNVRIYKNGIELAYALGPVDGVGTKNSDAANSIFINDGAGSREFNGNIDDVRIYNRVLSPTEVAQLYKQGGTKSAVTPVRTASSTGLSSGLVGHWTLDGKDTIWTSATAGTALDRSGYGNTGTLTNMIRATTTTKGKVGQALKFTYGAANQRVALSSPTTLDDIEAQGGGGMTISAWMYPYTSGLGGQGSIMNKGSEANTSNGAWMFSFRSGGMSFVKSYTNTILNRTTSNGSYALNKWQHVVMTWDGSSTASNVHIYINNVEPSYQTTTDGSGSKVSDAANNIAITSAGGSVMFNGIIDDVRVYNRVLSTAEVGQLYRIGQSRTR